MSTGPEPEATAPEPSGVVEPASANAVTIDPVTIEPVTIEPVTIEPVTTEPVTTEPVTATPLGDLVAAHFQRVEVAMLGRVLTTTLAGALPPTMVRVERRRTLIDRLTRRPGQAIGVSVTSADKTLTFRVPAVGVTEALVGHTVRGVVLSTERVSVSAWLDQLAEALNTATQDDEATRAALQRALT